MNTPIRYDETTHTFRMDGAGVSYVFGVNQNGELQSIYWGKRLRPADPIPAARSCPYGLFCSSELIRSLSD
jgi:alpha-galactosidase